MKRKKLDSSQKANEDDNTKNKDDDDKNRAKKSVAELDPLIVQWRETFQEAATDLLQRLRAQGGGGGGGQSQSELTLENLLVHFRIDPDLVRLNRDTDSFD